VKSEEGKSARHPRPTIGLLIDWVEGGYHSALWSGVADVSREQDVNLLCFVGGALHSPFGLDAQRNVIYDLVDAQRVHGLVIAMGTLGNFSDLEQSRSFCERYRPTPMVSIARTLAGIPSLVVDNRTGMYRAVTHLIKVHGHRRIAFIRGPADVQDADERYRAYADALAEHGLQLDPGLVVSGNFVRSSGSEAISLLLDERKVSFDAVVAANDDMALGALEALQAQGIQVPGDIAVTGFDNTEEARSSPLPMTTVRQPIYRLGRRAVEMVLAQLKGEEVSECVTIPSELVIRASCGCLDPAIVQASVGLETHSPVETATHETVQNVLEACREHIVAEMARAVEALPLQQEQVSQWAEQLLDGFAAELTSGRSGIFLRTVDEILQQVRAKGGSISAWHTAISVLRRNTLRSGADRAATSRCEDLWQQAQVLIGKASEQAQAYRRLSEQKYTTALRNASQILTTTFDVAELMDVVARELPRLGIKCCYLSLYEERMGNEALSEWSRMILAYDERGRVELEPGGRRFPSRQLVPDGTLHHEKRHSLLIEALFLGEGQIGFGVFEGNSRIETLYEMLRVQISSALSGALLFQERERAEQQLQRYAAELEQSNEEIKRFAYIVSHDLRAPLINLKGFASELCAIFEEIGPVVNAVLPHLEEKQRQAVATTFQKDIPEALGFIESSVIRMDRFIEAILGLSRLGRRELELLPIDMDELVEMTLRTLAHQIEKRQTRVFVDQLPQVIADRTSMEQIVGNVLGNAVKYLDPNRPGEIKITSERDHDMITFHVQDNGCGIAEKDMDTVFVPFRRAGVQDVEGEGMGLPYAQTLVRRHGGRMWCESEPGKGSTFSFSLPVQGEK
jgi:DNA-binding LacI/PurR family transcriptional regulator/signal transduction histidine kinase